MLEILLIVEPSVASRGFWRTRHLQKCSNSTRLVLQLSKMKQNPKTALVWLAFLMNANQNANQKPIGSAPAYRAQYTLPTQPIYQTLLFDFRGSGSEITVEVGMSGYTINEGPYNYFTMQVLICWLLLLPICCHYASGMSLCFRHVIMLQVCDYDFYVLNM